MSEPSAFDFLRNRPIQPYVPPVQPDEVTDQEKTGLETLRELQKTPVIEEKSKPVKAMKVVAKPAPKPVKAKKAAKPAAKKIVKKAVKKAPKKAAKPVKKMKKPVKKAKKPAAKKKARR